MLTTRTRRSRKTAARKSRRPTRRLKMEPLEQRQLLAVVLFTDSFEDSQWDGKWAQDSQNDWFDSTQRATDGDHSAEVDGRATDATLTMVSSIDMRAYDSVELTFDWLIEKDFRKDEYLALDFSPDGLEWTEIDRLSGNVDVENEWHSETIAIDPTYLTDAFQMRYRAKARSDRADANVDNVKIIGVQAGPPEISISDVTVTEGDASIQFIDAFVSAGSGGLNGPGDLVLGPDGNLYVSSKFGDSVLRYDAATGEFIDVFVPTSAGLDNPQGLVFGPDGNLYITSRDTNEVFRFNSATSEIEAFVTAGSGLDDAVELTFGVDGNLYVSSRNTDDVLRFDGTTGDPLGAFVAPGSGGLDGSHDLVFGPDGNLYVISQNNDSVLRYDGITGAFMDQFITTGSGGLDGPTHMVFGPGGDLYVSSAQTTDEVLRYDGTTGAFLEAYVSASSGGLDRPLGLLFDADGNLYVSSRDTNEVLRYGAASQAVFTVSLSSPSALDVTVTYNTANGDGTTWQPAIAGSDYTAVIDGTITFAAGETTRTIVIATLDDTEIESDETFTVNLSGAVGATIADGAGQGTILDDDTPLSISISDVTVTEGDLTAGFIDTFVSDGTGGIAFPSPVRFGPDGNLYVGSVHNDSIQRYDGTTGSFIDTFVTQGSGGLDRPEGLVFDADGDLYVASFHTDEVLRYDGSSGAFLGIFVTSGNGLSEPTGLAFGPDGNLYVTGANSDNVLRYDGATGAFIDAFVPTAGGGLDRPFSLTFGPDGHLYVASGFSNEILRYDGATGTFIDAFVTAGSGGLGGGSGREAWLEFGADGNLYVLNNINGTDNVLRYDGTTGAFIDVFVTTTSNQLDNARGMTFGPDGNLYVTYTNGGDVVLRYGRNSQAAFTVSLSSPSALDVTVTYSTADGDGTTWPPAIAGSDYTAVIDGTITFAPGETTRTIVVSTLDDAVEESTETFTVELSNPSNATIARGIGEGKILDDDAAPTISFPDFSDSTGLTLVGDAEIANGNILRLTPAVGGMEGAAWYTAEKQFVSVAWETTFDFNLNENSGGASNGSDGFVFIIQNYAETYLAGGGGTLGYNDLPNSLAVEFDTYANSEVGDPSESHISVHTNGVGPNGWDESLSLGSYSTPSIMDDATTHSVKIAYTPGTLTIFLDGMSTPVLTVAVDLADTLDLDSGRAWVGFTATTGGGYQNHDILNWDYTVLADTTTTIAVGNAEVIEGDSGTSNLVFTVTRQGDTTGVQTVSAVISDGTATTADNDYRALVSSTLTFYDGDTTGTFVLPVNGDLTVEAHETLTLDLTLDSGSALLADSQAVGTILNDDTNVSIDNVSVTEGDESIRFIDALVSAGNGGLDVPLGMIQGPDGNLYVASAEGDEVLRYNWTTGAFIDAFVSTADNGGLDRPRNLVFGPEGDLFVTSGQTDSVLRYGATGEFIGAFVTDDSTTSEEDESGGLDSPYSLVFHTDGYLYVTSLTNDNILRYEGLTGASPGAFIDVFVTAGSGGLDTPRTLEFAADGNLYVASTGSDSILRYNPDGTFKDTFVPSGSGGLDGPMEFTFGPDGNLYVASINTDSILRYNGTTGAFIDVYVPTGSGGLDNPIGMLFDSDGNLYVANGLGHEILRYGAASQAVFTVSLSSPSALPVTVDYYTSDGTARLVDGDYEPASGTVVFDPGVTTRTILVSTLDDTDIEDDETFVVNLTAATGAAIEGSPGVATIQDDDVPVPTTRFFVVDSGVDDTFEYDADGNLLTSSNLASANTNARGAAASADGSTVWVVDNSDKVYVYDGAGSLQNSWTAGGLNRAEGIATDETDIWILDGKSKKILWYDGAAAFDPSGTVNPTSSFPLDGANSKAKGITTDGTSIWVVNDDRTTDKVFKYNAANGTLLGSWTIDGANAKPTGITIDPSGASESIWIVDSGADAVYEYGNALGNSGGSLTGSFALAGENTNPQGIADPLAEAATDQVFSQEAADSLADLYWAASDSKASQPKKDKATDLALMMMMME